MIDYLQNLKELLKNISNDGFLEQMLRDNFEKLLLKDNNLITFILEDLNPREYTKNLLKAYRDNLPEGNNDYSFEKKIFLKYCNSKSPQNLYLEKVMSSIPIEKILEDKDFIKKVVDSDSEEIFYRKREIVDMLQKEDWYIELMIKNKKIKIHYFKDFDFSDLDRNLRIIEANKSNYQYFSLLERINPVILDCVLNDFSTNSIDVMNSIVNSIEDFHEGKINNLFSINDLPLNSNIVTPENYKDFFVDAGLYFKSFKYSEEDFIKVMTKRAQQLSEILSVKNFENSSIVEFLLGDKSLNNRNLTIKSAFQLIVLSKELLNNFSNYKVQPSDLNLIKSVMKSCVRSNTFFKSSFSEITKAFFELEYNKHDKSSTKEITLKNLKNIESLMLHAIIETEAPINSNIKSRKLKF